MQPFLGRSSVKDVIAIRFESEVLKLLRQIADDRDMSVSALVGEAVSLYLNTEPKKPAATTETPAAQ